jgi:predicted amidohydrolase
MDEISVSLISVSASSDRKSNISNAIESIHRSKDRGAKWIFLPEMFSFHGPYDLLWDAAEEEDGPLNSLLSKTARDLDITLFAGSVPERSPDKTTKKVFNTQYVFSSSGQVIAKYQKIHLFNLKDPSGKPLYCESDGFLAGSSHTVFEHEGWRIALATCYDLRFPQMFAAMTKSRPVDLIVLPAAFTLQTGAYHWHLLNRARAVENLCYLVAANQVGTHSPGKSSFGHSLVVDPWGTIIGDGGSSVGTIHSSIDKSKISKCRTQLPVLDNRRSDTY